MSRAVNAGLEHSPRHGLPVEGHQLRFDFYDTWDPHEVWCTRVRPRPVEMAHAVLGPGGRVRSIPRRVWPLLVLALLLGFNREMVGIFRIDLIGLLFGVMTPAARAAHILLGISTICTVIVSTAAGRP